ncbi:MAG TPA: RNA polymerase sigma factor [Vicinamibacterales bacterium]|nr:RNA polymerase sigma factor [Vicinamibacterales bacterium]
MTIAKPDARAMALEQYRAELITYATRMVVRPDIAEELVQEAAIRLLQSEQPLADLRAIRPWLFRVVSNLAIDHLRRHSTWRELVLVDARERADASPAFIAESTALRGSPELSAIAREHLAVCFACTLRNLNPEHAAALLLKEVHDLSTAEIAEALGGSTTQVKNWLQQARRTLEQRYAHTCALVTKQGVCHQCVELDGFFNDQRRDPLEGTPRTVRARLAILRETRERALGPWHRRMVRLIDEVLGYP